MDEIIIIDGASFRDKEADIIYILLPLNSVPALTHSLYAEAINTSMESDSRCLEPIIGSPKKKQRTIQG